MKPKDIPVLDVYMSFPDAAALLNISKQAFHKLVFSADAFAPSELMQFGDKPAYGVSRAAVEKLAIRRHSAAVARVVSTIKKGMQ